MKNHVHGGISMGERFSNYEKMKNEMAGVFLRYDQEQMIRRFSLESDAGYLYIPFVGRNYRIDRHTGMVQQVDEAATQEADYNEAMTIYDVLCYAKANCRPAGVFVNMNGLSSVQTGSLSRGGSFFQKTIDFFQGKTALLAGACKALDGTEEKGGDVAFRIEMFPFLSMILRFWDADDEFPASLQILVDKNILEYMHYETMMFALSHVMGRLKEAAGNDKG